VLRFLPLILKNSWRNRRRTSFTILSVGISMCLLGVLLASYKAIYYSQATPAEALRLVTRNRVSLTFPLPQSYRERMKQVPGVDEVVLSQWYGGVYKDAREMKNFFARFAVEPERLFSVYGEIQLPDDQKAAFFKDRTGCIVGRDLQKKLGFQIGDRIMLTGDIFAGTTLDLTVRGIFDSPIVSEVLYFNREYLVQQLPVARRGEIGTFVIKVNSPEVATRVANQIDDMFRNAPVQTRTETEQAFSLSFVAFLGNVKMYLFSISAAVTFTILLVSANTMAMSARERVREVGVLKTLGFTPGVILSIIVGEAGAISVAGGLLGLALASVLCAGVRNGPTFIYELKKLHIEPGVGLACLLLALLIGVASSFVPAWNASRISIVDALRSTD
jgi:putative ABC transport system permease protein